MRRTPHGGPLTGAWTGEERGLPGPVGPVEGTDSTCPRGPGGRSLEAYAARSPSVETGVMVRDVYDFTDGGRDLADLLGG